VLLAVGCTKPGGMTGRPPLAFGFAAHTVASTFAGPPDCEPGASSACSALSRPSDMGAPRALYCSEPVSNDTPYFCTRAGAVCC
jgi:hypothetical protein